LLKSLAMENQQSLQDQYLATIRQVIDANIGNENFSVADLAREAGLSRSMLHRKLIRLTGKSATDLITEIRLTKAYELLENDTGTVSEIAYRVGYSSPSYFNKVFKKTYKVSAGDVRRKGSGKISHLRVIKEPGDPGSARSKRSRSNVIAGANILMIIIVILGIVILILGLIDNVSPVSILPEWTITLTLIILIVGFIIAVVLSWVYNIHPVEDIDKTESVPESRSDFLTKSSKIWKTVSYISFVVIVGLIVLNIIPRNNRGEGSEVLDKSIAVLPFRNDSPDEENAYFINGTMEAILDNLCKIKDLRVVGRTSVEQYRNAPKPIPIIADEMNVSYILEGSGQKYGNKVRLTLQLLDARNEEHIWSSPFSREIVIEDIFELQSEIALLVAKEIEAIITSEEKQRMEKIPNTSLTAYDFYLRGLEEFNHGEIERAQNLYYKALEYDSTFAQAYTGLARVYWNKHYWETFFSERFLDSVLILADKALSFDPQLSDAYTVRGNYYRENGQNEQAISEYDKAIKLNPNDGMAYYWRGWTYENNNFNLVKALEDYYKAASLYRGPFLPSILRDLGWAYWQAGFPEKLGFYEHQALMLDGDSISYYHDIYWTENWLANGNGKILEKIYLMDTTRNDILQLLGNLYGFEGKFEESLMYLNKYFKKLEDLGSYSVLNMQRLGYAYWMNGFYTEADYYFDKTIEYYDDLINVGRKMFSTNYDLAGIYAFRGEKEKAYENLRIFNQLERIPFWWISLFKIDPLFDSIRDEPEFQQIVRDVEAKYQEEQDRVRKWLEENDML